MMEPLMGSVAVIMTLKVVQSREFTKVGTCPGGNTISVLFRECSAQSMPALVPDPYNQLFSGAVLSQGQKPGQSPQMSPKGPGSSQQTPQYAPRPYVPYNPHLTSDGSDSRAAKSGETCHAFSPWCADSR